MSPTKTAEKLKPRHSNPKKLMSQLATDYSKSPPSDDERAALKTTQTVAPKRTLRGDPKITKFGARMMMPKLADEPAPREQLEAFAAPATVTEVVAAIARGELDPKSSETTRMLGDAIDYNAIKCKHRKTQHAAGPCEKCIEKHLAELERAAAKPTLQMKCYACDETATGLSPVRSKPGRSPAEDLAANEREPACNRHAQIGAATFAPPGAQPKLAAPAPAAKKTVEPAAKGSWVWLQHDRRQRAVLGNTMSARMVLANYAVAGLTHEQAVELANTIETAGKQVSDLIASFVDLFPRDFVGATPDRAAGDGRAPRIDTGARVKLTEKGAKRFADLFPAAELAALTVDVVKGPNAVCVTASGSKIVVPTAQLELAS